MNDETDTLNQDTVELPGTNDSDVQPQEEPQETPVQTVQDTQQEQSTPVENVQPDVQDDDSGSSSSSIFNLAKALLKAAVGFDDDLAKILSEKLLSMVVEALQDPESAQTLINTTKDAVNLMTKPGIGKILAALATGTTTITTAIPDAITSMLGFGKISENLRGLTSLGDEITNREEQNRMYAASYPSSVASPEDALASPEFANMIKSILAKD